MSLGLRLEQKVVVSIRLPVGVNPDCRSFPFFLVKVCTWVSQLWHCAVDIWSQIILLRGGGGSAVYYWAAWQHPWPLPTEASSTDTLSPNVTTQEEVGKITLA